MDTLGCFYVLLWISLSCVSNAPLPRSVIIRKVLPIAFCFAVSLASGNQAYLFISVSFVQMLKAFTPVVVLLFAFSIGLETISTLQLVIVFTISLGVALSAIGEMRFSLPGFLFQLIGIVSEAARLVLVDLFLKDLKLDALSTLYYLAPLSFFFILLGFVHFELPVIPQAVPSPGMLGTLLVSGVVAFALNISIVLLIKHTSAITMSICGLLKDILLIIFSIVIFRSPVTLLQGIGYSLSLIALNVYKEFKQDRTKVVQCVNDVCSSLGSAHFFDDTIDTIDTRPSSETTAKTPDTMESSPCPLSDDADDDDERPSLHSHFILSSTSCPFTDLDQKSCGERDHESHSLLVKNSRK